MTSLLIVYRILMLPILNKKKRMEDIGRELYTDGALMQWRICITLLSLE